MCECKPVLHNYKRESRNRRDFCWAGAVFSTRPIGMSAPPTDANRSKIAQMLVEDITPRSVGSVEPQAPCWNDTTVLDLLEQGKAS